MSEFGDFTGGGMGSFNPPVDAFGMSDDLTADFLAREQAALGDEAALFGNDLAQNNLQGMAANDFNTDYDAMNMPKGASFTSQNSGFGSTGAYPLVNEITGQSNPSYGQNQSGAGFESMEAEAEQEVEPEHIRQWKEDFNTIVAQRDAKSKTKHDEILKEAKESLDRFYAEYNEKKSKSVNRNKELEKKDIAKRSETTGPEKVWERVWQHIEEASQSVSTAASTKGKVDLKKNGPGGDKKGAKSAKPVTKTRDTARMRQLLLTLKKDNKAPGIEASA